MKKQVTYCSGCGLMKKPGEQSCPKCGSMTWTEKKPEHKSLMARNEVQSAW